MGDTNHRAVAELVGRRYGPVARNETVAADPRHDDDLWAYAELLPILDDATFVSVAADAIAASAVAASSGDAQHVHARHAMAHAEAVRRHVAAGHGAECSAVRLYALAYARAVREARLDPQAPGVPACTCGVGGQAGGARPGGQAGGARPDGQAGDGAVPADRMPPLAS